MGFWNAVGMTLYLIFFKWLRLDSSVSRQDRGCLTELSDGVDRRSLWFAFMDTEWEYLPLEIITLYFPNF